MKSTGRHFRQIKDGRQGGNGDGERLKTSEVYRKGGKVIGRKAIPLGGNFLRKQQIRNRLGLGETRLFFQLHLLAQTLRLVAKEGE